MLNTSNKSHTVWFFKLIKFAIILKMTVGYKFVMLYLMSDKLYLMHLCKMGTINSSQMLSLINLLLYLEILN